MAPGLDRDSGQRRHDHLHREEAELGHDLHLPGTGRQLGRQGPASNSASARPQAPPTCVLTLTASVDFLENGTGAVATYTATASHCGTLTWSPVGLEDADLRA